MEPHDKGNREDNQQRNPPEVSCQASHISYYVYGGDGVRISPKTLPAKRKPTTDGDGATPPSAPASDKPDSEP